MVHIMVRMHMQMQVEGAHRDGVEALPTSYSLRARFLLLTPYR